MLTLPCRLCSTCAGHLALSDEAFYCRWHGLTFDRASGLSRRCYGFRYAGLAEAAEPLDDAADFVPSSEAGKARLVTRVLRAKDTAALVTSGVKSGFRTNRPQSGAGR